MFLGTSPSHVGFLELHSIATRVKTVELQPMSLTSVAGSRVQQVIATALTADAGAGHILGTLDVH
jgi:hypothetical protein